MNGNKEIINLAETNIFASPDESPLIWLPIFFSPETPLNREDGYCALVQLRRPGGEIETHKYTIVYQRSQQDQQIQYYTTFDRQFLPDEDSLMHDPSDAGLFLRVYDSLESAKAGVDTDIRHLCGDPQADYQAVLPY